MLAAIANFAGKHNQVPIALFITVTAGDRRKFLAVAEAARNAGAKRGVLFYILSAQK